MIRIARVLVCEKGKRWAIALRRALGPAAEERLPVAELAKRFGRHGESPKVLATSATPGESLSAAQLGGSEYRIVETRSLEECWQELSRSPASLVALELMPGNVEEVVGRLLDLGRCFRQAKAVVLAGRGLESYEWVLREAGAVHVLFSSRDTSAATRLIKQHMKGVAEPDVGFHETVWRSLPWSGSSPVLYGERQKQI